MALQVRLKPKFPAQVNGGTGISVAKSGGVYTINWDIDSIIELASITASDRDNLLIPVYNEDTLAYRIVALDTLLTSISAGLDDTLVSIAALNPTTNESIYFTATNTAAVYSITAGGRALVGVTGAADLLPYFTGAGTATTTSFTAQGRALLDDTTAAANRATVGLASSTTDNAVSRYDSTTGATQNSIVLIDDSGNLSPATTDTGALGTTSLNWADLFLDSGAVINFDSGDVTFTHTADTLTMAGGVLVLPNAGLQIGASVPFSDSAGTLTLQNVDALDAATEATIEAAIDTLANLTSVQGQSVTLAGALTTAGALITTGANSLTLTTTGATVSTLPVGTRTLASLDGSEALSNKTYAGSTVSLTSFVDFTEESSPASPAADHMRLFVKDVAAASHLFTRDSGGTEVDLTASIAGAGVSSLNGVAGAISVSVSTQYFTASGTWTKPAGLKFATVQVWGGGGGGDVAITGYGGSGGGYSEETLAAAALGATETVTIGAAGTTTPGAGGTSSFGALLSATGGGVSGAAAGAGSGGDINRTGQVGGTGVATVVNGPGGSAPFQSGAGLTANSVTVVMANSGCGGPTQAAGAAGLIIVKQVIVA